MPRAPIVPRLLIPLDPSSPVPLHRQLFEGVREAIVDGRLPTGGRIPSTRSLAQDLGVSRTTVVVAFEHLMAEGYLLGSVGSGSYVARHIPDHLLQVRQPAGDAVGPGARAPRVALRVAALNAIPRGPFLGRGARPFRPGIPPVDVFPLAVWSRLAARRYRGLSRAELYHGLPAGYPPLCQAIAEYLAAARGVRCTPGQVLVLSSAQEAMELSCRVLLDPGDDVWLEDPSWGGATGAMIAAGARIAPVPVDGEGLVVEQGIAAAPDARLVYVSPSHQYPAGVTLSLPRRRALLEWAEASGAWILEDDYDSEFRYAGRPLTALHGLDRAGRVLYIGTFNKTLFPGLRVGYIVVPQALVEPFLVIRRIGAQHAPPIDQAILADFIVQGHYARHVRRMRAICEERRDALVTAVRRELGRWLEVDEPETGLHAIGLLGSGLDDREVSAAAATVGVEVAPLSALSAGPQARRGLVLGYAAYRPSEIRAAIRKLGDVFAGLDPAPGAPSGG
jgi:GntR family transcriptional regulator / MocR family aminotransferase